MPGSRDGGGEFVERRGTGGDCRGGSVGAGSVGAGSAGDGPFGDGSVVDRRLGLDRRKMSGGGAADPVTGLERRRGPGRRRSDFRAAAEDGEMNQEQFLFLMAIDAFKKANGTSFPSWSDVLEVVRLLGYRKTAASELKLPNAEDWRERPDAASGVRPDGWERRFNDEEKAALDLAYGMTVGEDELDAEDGEALEEAA